MSKPDQLSTEEILLAVMSAGAVTIQRIDGQYGVNTYITVMGTGRHAEGYTSERQAETAAASLRGALEDVLRQIEQPYHRGFF